MTYHLAPPVTVRLFLLDVKKKGKRAGLNGHKEVLALVLKVLKLVLLMMTQAVLALALAFRV